MFDCAGAGRVFGVRIGLPDWNNVLAMPGHRVCTAVAMQPPAGPPQVESDLADRRQPETNYRRAEFSDLITLSVNVVLKLTNSELLIANYAFDEITN